MYVCMYVCMYVHMYVRGQKRPACLVASSILQKMSAEEGEEQVSQFN